MARDPRRVNCTTRQGRQYKFFALFAPSEERLQLSPS